LVLFLALFPKPHCGGLGKSPAIETCYTEGQRPGSLPRIMRGRETLMLGFGGGEERRQI